MPDTATVQTGAEQAAAKLAKRLTKAGWDVRVNRTDSHAPKFSTGEPMWFSMRQAAVHAAGPRSIGHPLLNVFWTSDLPTEGYDAKPRPDRFEALVYLGDARFELAAKAQFGAWLDALLAVAAALDA